MTRRLVGERTARCDRLRKASSFMFRHIRLTPMPAVLVLCLLLLIGACGGPPSAGEADAVSDFTGGRNPANETGGVSDPTGETPLSEAARSGGKDGEDTAADAEVGATAPLVLTKTQDRGRVLYAHYCIHCHGASGRGDGPNTYELAVRPRKFLDEAFQASRTNGQIAQVISLGGAACGFSNLMPPWGRVLDGERIGDLVAMIRILPELERRRSGLEESTAGEDEDTVSDFSL